MGNENVVDSPRIDRRFVGSDGTLTDGAYSFLWKLWRRTGGAFGDEENDIHGDGTDSLSLSLFGLTDQVNALPPPIPFVAVDRLDPPAHDFILPDNLSPPQVPSALQSQSIDDLLTIFDPETRAQVAELIKRIAAIETASLQNTLEQLEGENAEMRATVARLATEIQGLQQSSLI